MMWWLFLEVSMTSSEGPSESLFGLDNLPYGVFSVSGASPRVGVRINDSVIDLASALDEPVFANATLNPFMAQGRRRWVSVRRRIVELVCNGAMPRSCLVPVSEVRMHMPFDVADYVDFYASEHHATNLGRLFRPDGDPLTPNWRHLPIGYHGRSGSVVVSGTDVMRPCGQSKGSDGHGPGFGPSIRLDIEAEIGFVVGVGSPVGVPISTDSFAEHVFGAVIVNDWSARDIQSWEYVPLGPFLGKSFATSISPWVVPLDALQSARLATPPHDHSPLAYLQEAQGWGLDIDLSIVWNGTEISRPPYAAMYWSPAQMLAHCTVNGSGARTGDLFASGTVSGDRAHQLGSFIELTRNGAEPVTVGGQKRTFLEDGDEVVISASAPGQYGGRIGFGEVRGRITPAREMTR